MAFLARSHQEEIRFGSDGAVAGQVESALLNIAAGDGFAKDAGTAAP
jgi:hypothetical protein